jgi:hypothetical protein
MENIATTCNDNGPHMEPKPKIDNNWAMIPGQLTDEQIKAIQGIMMENIRLQERVEELENRIDEMPYSE